MKRKTMLILILLCAAGLFAQQGGSQAGSQLAGPQLVGEITELIGTVELKPSGQANFIPAKTGDTVAADTIVSTGLKSSALIKAGSTVLTVRPLNRLSLSEISSSAGTETLNVNIQTGRVKVDVNPPAGTRVTTVLRSPVATASVRGTSFEFDTQNLTVLEGTVAFQGSQGGTMLISAGSSSEISGDGRPTDPIETFTARLLPLPPAGSDTGFINSRASASDISDSGISGGGEFGLGFELH